MATAAKTTRRNEASTTGGFTAEEKAAMRERAREAKAEAKRGADRAAGLQALLDKVAEFPEPDRSMAMKVHEIVTSIAPDLLPKTYYGMPAYAREGGKQVVFFQPASKFKVRYSTLGFDEGANLDEGSLWATSYAVTSIGPAEEKRIRELVKKAVG
jgi:uncharacterized protein YdhG (YjbR/CyaY superfamily)